MRKIAAVCVLLILVMALSSQCGGASQSELEVDLTMNLYSVAFEDGGIMPQKYAYKDANVSPPLNWDSVPSGTVSFAFICDDPDAPGGTWVHWVLFNLPGDTTELPEGVPKQETLESGGKQGKNDFGRVGYDGPSPPSGTHRYYFKIYALDTELDLDASAKKSDLLEAMEGHVLAGGQLIGKYQKQ